MNGPQDCVDEIRAIYRARRDVLVKSMAQRGLGHSVAGRLDVRLGADAGKIPRRPARWNSPSACSMHAKVAVSPGIGFGEYGEGYVRVALVENEHRIRQAARNVKKFLSHGHQSRARRSGVGQG